MKAIRTIIRWGAGHPTAANLLMLIFLFIGALSAGELRRETFPDYSSTLVEIRVPYPGATPEDVETAVCERVEDALDGITDLEEVRSDALEGVGKIIAEMRDGGDIARFIDDVKTEVEAIDDFPDETERPVIRQLGRTDMVVSLAVTGPMSVPHLKRYCEELKDRLMRTGRISQIDILGFSDHEIEVAVPLATLMEYGLGIDEIARRISRGSVNLPAGTIETRDADVVVRFNDERRTVRQLRDLIVIAGDTGAELRLGDFARITDQFETDENKILFNGKRAGILTIMKTKDEDSLTVMDTVQEFLEKERKLAPASVEFAITKNISKIVRDRLNMLVENGIAGLILVFLSMWLFFSLRYSFWVAMGLPVSFMGALFAMNLIGFSLDMLTMVGLLLAIGLLMDDAIVIAENIAHHLDQGKRPLDAAADGTAEVFPGVLSSFLTTVCVFGSIAVLISGQIGKILWVMPVTLLLTLSVSLVEAFLILPNHLAHSISTRETPGRFRAWFDSRVDRFRENVVGRIADTAIEHRYLTVGLVIALLLASLAMPAGGHLKFMAFPELDGDVLEARILLPQGTPIERTATVVHQVSEALETINERLTPEQPDALPLVENIIAYYGVNADAFETGPHIATVSADLLSAEVRSTTIDQLTAAWRKELGPLADVIVLTFKEPALGPAGLAVDIRLHGDDLHELKQAAHELTGYLGAFDGVLDLNDDLRPGKPEIRASLRQGAMTFGVDAATIASQLRTAFHGTTADEIMHEGETYEINVRVDLPDPASLAVVDDYYVTAPSGAQVPLKTLARLEEDRGWARIARVDGVRTVTVRGDVNVYRANAAELIGLAETHFLPSMIKRHPSVSYSLEGQAKEGGETAASLRKAMLIGIFGVFVLLSFQFRSYIEPFVILCTIPMAFIGVIWGHMLMGLDLSMPGIMGFVSLAGVVVNGSILLVQFIKSGIRNGLTPQEAASTASRRRFRSVLLTSLTTIMGVLPLLLETSLQAQVLIPLATSLVFGLLSSTLLVLFVVPALYTILDDLGLAKRISD